MSRFGATTPRSVVAALAVFLAGCANRDLLVVGMQASFDEQFHSACAGDAPCQVAVETHGEACFDRGLALQAIDADAAAKKQVNAAHIRMYQACVAQASGKDHWVGKDMPAFILDQVGD